MKLAVSKLRASMPMTVTYFQGSRDPELAYLSNLQRLPEDAYVTIKLANGEEIRCSSVEAAFQLSKLFYSNATSEQIAELARTHAGHVGTQAKTIGSKKTFSVNGLALDVKAWDCNKQAIMERLLRERAQCDERFRKIIVEYFYEKKVVPVHAIRGTVCAMTSLALMEVARSYTPEELKLTPTGQLEFCEPLDSLYRSYV
jgi:hypothetical protein